jgi:hypothetical protein
MSVCDGLDKRCHRQAPMGLSRATQVDRFTLSLKRVGRSGPVEPMKKPGLQRSPIQTRTPLHAADGLAHDSLLP